MPGISKTSDRNITLDFFRGLALLVIFVNHIPGNEASLYTPSRFGLSDAAEIFVFLSGYAAAIAYGKSFQTAGFAMGSFRVFHRCFQIYSAHLALFTILVLVCVLGNAALATRDYVDHLNIRYFFDHTEEALLYLMSLRYVPNYFDILPMYLVVMLWIPAVWALSRFHPVLALLFSLGVYLAMWDAGLELPADPHSARPWFFNPFGWQLLFFIGFAFGARWLRPPAVHRVLVLVCLAFIMLSVPLSPEPAMRPTEGLQRLHADLLPWLEKTRFGPLRLLHFLAAAYLATSILHSREHWLHGGWVRPVIQMGRLSLPMFMVTMVLSYVAGMAFDLTGHGLVSIVAINGGGVILLLAIARLMTWIKSSPWKQESSRPDMPEVAVRSMPLLPWVWIKGVVTAALLGAVTVFPLLLLRSPAEPEVDAMALNIVPWSDPEYSATVRDSRLMVDFPAAPLTE